MKKIITVFLCLITIAVQAQTLQEINGYGYKWKRGKFTNYFVLPVGDTSVSENKIQGAIMMHSGDSKLYYFNGTKWTASGGTASGTLTSFSSGNLSPLFTTSVATPTTTPVQSFTLSNAGAYTLFGRGSGTGVPSYQTSIDSNWIPSVHTEDYYNTKYVKTRDRFAFTGEDTRASANRYFSGANSYHFTLDSLASFSVYTRPATIAPKYYTYITVGNYGAYLSGYDDQEKYRSLIGVEGQSRYSMMKVYRNNSEISSLIFDSVGLFVNDNGSSRNSSAIIDANSTSKGFLPPRLTTTQRDAINSPATGLQIYNTTLDRPQYYNGTIWGNYSEFQNLQSVLTVGDSAYKRAVLKELLISAPDIDNPGNPHPIARLWRDTTNGVSKLSLYNGDGRDLWIESGDRYLMLPQTSLVIGGSGDPNPILDLQAGSSQGTAPLFSVKADGGDSAFFVNCDGKIKLPKYDNNANKDSALRTDEFGRIEQFSPANITQTLTNKTISGSSNTLSNIATTSLTGTLQADQMPALTGDITNTAGSLSTTIANGAVTQAKTANYSANTIWGNSSNSSATASNITYKDVAAQTYTGTITWTGTTAPSGTTNHTYRWSQIGNTVTLIVTLVYGTAGTALTDVTMTLPTDCPSPAEPNGLTGANNIHYPGCGFWSANLSGMGSAARFGLSSNASDNGYLLAISGSSLGVRVASITITYKTN